MKLGKNEHTTESLIEYLTKRYGAKLSKEPFCKNDIGQYLNRGMVPYRYGGGKISSVKENGVRIITLIER
jgi:hypothetical protein